MSGQLPYGIHINCIAPGYMVTDMTAPMRSEASRMAETNTRIPMERWGCTRKISAGAAIFLASDASDYVNGFTIAVDGSFSKVLSSIKELFLLWEKISCRPDWCGIHCTHCTSSILAARNDVEMVGAFAKHIESVEKHKELCYSARST